MELQWYVLNYNWNERKVISFNIFQNWKFKEAIEEELAKVHNADCSTDINEFTERVKSLARWQFWCRREYEISVGDLYEQDLEKYEKIDVYRQIEMNIDNFVRYLLDSE